MTTRSSGRRRATRWGVGAVTLALTLAACAPSPTTGGADSERPSRLTVVTHDSFALGEETLQSFRDESGYEVTFVAPGDAGSLVNQLVLTKESPLGDVVYGIDNTFAGRALAEGVLAAYESPALPDAAAPLAADDSGRLTPIDVGDVCLNADLGWFSERGLAVPETLDDLLDPRYADLLVVSNPASSSPGLAFLAATVAAKGDPGYLDYWAALKANGLLVARDWTEAYSVQFSGSSGNGPRPLVLSYATSPAFEVTDGEAPTRALLDTCFRQVEYAGVIEGASNPEGARAFVDFLLSERVQAEIPEQMYMYPVSPEVELPTDWVAHAPLAEDPYELDAATIAEGRDRWIRAWTNTVVG